VSKSSCVLGGLGCSGHSHIWLVESGVICVLAVIGSAVVQGVAFGLQGWGCGGGCVGWVVFPPSLVCVCRGSVAAQLVLAFCHKCVILCDLTRLCALLLRVCLCFWAVLRGLAGILVAGCAVKEHGAAGICSAATPALVPGCIVGCSTCCVGDVGLHSGVVHVASGVLVAGGGIARLASFARLHGGACGPCCRVARLRWIGVCCDCGCAAAACCSVCISAGVVVPFTCIVRCFVLL
jgi:hypothetical protein